MGIYNVFFSPGGTTGAVSNIIASGFGEDVRRIDLLRESIKEDYNFNKDDIVVVSMPCFAGRVPVICLEPLSFLKGVNTPVITAITYGNRNYDDALLELNNILDGNGFKVVGSCCIVSRHSIFPKVAEGRPSENDFKDIKDFALLCKGDIEEDNIVDFTVPGNTPYKKLSGKGMPIHPKGSNKCTNCGVCSKICPVGAIDKDSPRITDTEKCINCTACIYNCKFNARGYSGIKYFIGSRKFKKANGSYKESEFFRGKN